MIVGAVVLVLLVLFLVYLFVDAAGPIVRFFVSVFFVGLLVTLVTWLVVVFLAAIKVLRS